MLKVSTLMCLQDPFGKCFKTRGGKKAFNFLVFHKSKRKLNPGNKWFFENSLGSSKSVQLSELITSEGYENAYEFLHLADNLKETDLAERPEYSHPESEVQ